MAVNSVHELQLEIERKFVRKNEFQELTDEVKNYGRTIVENQTELKNIVVTLEGINANLKWVVKVVLGAVLLAILGVVLL